MPSEQPPEPWLAFFNELDSQLSEPVALHCLGGFVVIHVYEVARKTNDCDFIAWIPADSGAELLQLAGRDSPLLQKYRVYLDPVTVANCPDDYETRLTAIFEGQWRFLNLFASRPTMLRFPSSNATMNATGTMSNAWQLPAGSIQRS